MPDLPAHLLLAWSAYVLGTGSPGPSNLAIMATAMNEGRRSAVALAAGVVTGASTILPARNESRYVVAWAETTPISFVFTPVWARAAAAAQKPEPWPMGT